MLRPYSAPHQQNKKTKKQQTVVPHLPLFGFSPTRGGGCKPRRLYKTLKAFGVICILFLLSSDVLFQPFEQLFHSSRNLCAYFLGDLEEDSFWEEAFAAFTSYLVTDVTSMPPGEIGFVVTIPMCPEDAFGMTNPQTHDDPGHALYDAAAVLKYTIESNLNLTGVYSATMHAIIHPDAIFCTTPNGKTYDRARVLESIGYHVVIKGSPIIDETGAMVNISDPYVMQNVNNDAGERDLMALYASHIENQTALVLTDFESAFVDQLDPVLNDFINDPDAEIAFSMTPPYEQEPVYITTSPTPLPGTSAPTYAPTTATPSTSTSPTMAPTTTASPTFSPTPAPTRPPIAPGETYAPVVPTNAPTSRTGSGSETSPLTDETRALFVDGANTIDMNTMVLLKTDASFVQNITDLYTNTSYNPVSGWNSSGIGAYSGALGTTGILTYYYTHIAPTEKVKILDECKYGNGKSARCKTMPASEAKVVNMKKCGAPWTCPDQSHLTAEEQEQCKVYEKFWYQSRQAFEDGCFQGSPGSDNSGTFKADVTLGFCAEEGKVGYNRLVGDVVCNKEKENGVGQGVLMFQSQQVTGSVGKTTGGKVSCVAAKIEKPGVLYNIAIVIDHSASSALEFTGGSKRADINNDGVENTILDAEIISALGLLESICEQGELDNNSVTIGFISFNTDAKYWGVYDPCGTGLPEEDPSQVNPTLRSHLVSLRAEGDSNYSPPLWKSMDYYNEAPQDGTNTMFFMSDGKPTMDGVTEAQQTLSWKNPAPVSYYADELTILNNMEVHRVCVGAGSGSDVRTGYDLEIIDNTDTGPQERAIAQVLTHNPMVGRIVNFQVIVNDKPNWEITKDDLVEGLTGYTLEDTPISGLDPTYGKVNKIEFRTTLETADGTQNTMISTTSCKGSLL